MSMLIIISIVTGLIAGLILGMLGGGSGLALVPGISLIMNDYTNTPTEMGMRFAVGTTFAVTLFFVLSSVYSQHKHRQIHWPLVWKLMPGLVIGTIFGNIFANQLPSHTLRLIFGIVILLLAIRMMLQDESKFQAKPWPHHSLFFAAATFFGLVCGGLGIAPFIVPYLKRHGVPMHTCIGTSTACGFFFAAIGTITTIASGWNATQGIPHALGYVYLPVVLPLIITCAITAELGIRIARRLSGDTLKKAYCLLMVGVGLMMLWMA